VIELDRVTKNYRHRTRRSAALREVSVQIPAGSVTAVVGPNGAGKSTLLGIVLGFVRPSSGAVQVAGLSPREYLREEGAAYLPERFTLPRGWRTADALGMFARLDGGSGSDAERASARFGLEQHAGKAAHELSRGLLQRVGLAQALLVERRLVVLDEPTEGLDPIWRIRLRDVVAELRAGGCTVIIASHDLGEVERVADRALLLEGGVLRDVLDLQAVAQPSSYLVRLDAAFPRIVEVFPDAQPLASGTGYRVSVPGPVELSERVGALIALGGVITAVQPERADLEDRVRAALEDEG
jgi:ABC-2 type transport system ATP-binding protein